ncbi:NAD(P)-binding domain containing protein [Parasponia andersonii]|uniref:NAD(P)-binding domain containing protein n=1 Tax=Parasponia andersonii TaxID=3476 RepID=A0A2P5BHW8_PARAD|nr:NAD(P)-binding domain containing protein [Parasponia andersonii]
MAENKGTVCVTGGTGFIGSWLIMRLLQHGYTVRTTIRPDPEGKSRDISFLTNLPRASEKLRIFHADLNQPDIFHVAHPVDIYDKIPEETATKRAVDAALGILMACLASKTVKRVVHTSSVAAVVASGNVQPAVDESSWSDIEYYRSLKRIGISYVAAKTKTEKAVLEFSEKFGLDVVALNPSLVMGPFICPSLPASVAFGLTMIFGNKDQYKHLEKTDLVHIDDVASAHIHLFENPSAKGRYICSSDELSLIQMSEFLSAKYPDFQIPTKESLQGIDQGYKVCSLSSKKLLDSGFRYKYGLDDMFDGAIQRCREKGVL